MVEVEVNVRASKHQPIRVQNLVDQVVEAGRVPAPRGGFTRGQIVVETTNHGVCLAGTFNLSLDIRTAAVRRRTSRAWTDPSARRRVPIVVEATRLRRQPESGPFADKGAEYTFPEGGQ
jgi:hypothetical protein